MQGAMPATTCPDPTRSKQNANLLYCKNITRLWKIGRWDDIITTSDDFQQLGCYLFPFDCGIFRLQQHFHRCSDSCQLFD